MKIELSLEAILEVIDLAEMEGSGPEAVQGLASLDEAGPSDLSFLGNARYKKQVPESRAGWILVSKGYDGQPGSGQGYLRVENPSLALGQICALLETQLWPQPPSGIHPSAVVDPTAKIDPSARIGALCVVGSGARIGEGSLLEAGVAVGKEAQIGSAVKVFSKAVIADYCVVGDRCRISQGAVIGSDGFGYDSGPQGHSRIPQVGRVVLEADVDIGANATLDRARFSETHIGRGTKIDNLVQIAHNCRFGRYCLVVAQAGIAGSCTFGNFVVIGGQAGFAGHIEVGDGAMIGAQAGISKKIEPGEKLRGSPSLPIPVYQRLFILQKRLPDLFERVGRLEEQLD